MPPDANSCRPPSRRPSEVRAILDCRERCRNGPRVSPRCSKVANLLSRVERLDARAIKRPDRCALDGRRDQHCARAPSRSFRTQTSGQSLLTSHFARTLIAECSAPSGLVNAPTKSRAEQKHGQSICARRCCSRECEGETTTSDLGRVRGFHFTLRQSASGRFYWPARSSTAALASGTRESPCGLVSG